MRCLTLWTMVVLLPCSLPAILAAGESPAEGIVAGELRYPEAKHVSELKSTSVKSFTEQSTDEVAKVVTHYRAVMGIDRLAEVCAVAGGKGAPADLVEYVAEGSKSESGAVSVIATCKATFQTRTASVTVIIVRPSDSKVTTITVNHVSLGE